MSDEEGDPGPVFAAFNLSRNDGSVRAEAVPSEIAILAGIGDVCLQWARLEMCALAVIGALEMQETDATWLRHGGLDLLPRMNLSILLAGQKGFPATFAQTLRSARGKIQGKRGLAVRRNEVVHGAHKNLVGNRVTLTMTRYPEGRRDISVDPFDLHELATQIHDLGDELWALCDEIGQWHIKRAFRAES